MQKEILNRPLASLNEAAMSESFVRGSGKGGQKVNKTSNKVVLTHHAYDITVECHQTRSLEQNRKIARKLMKEKVDAFVNGEASKSSVKARMASSNKTRNKAKASARRRKKREEKSDMRYQ
ncbi:hypothetical protein TeGR_g14893 [Tetraparma gracilis]|jgi:protein subunit release factor B|uniref:Prokaryotic-type class I peptide chain release factors domain-containing protein n=1 Tax=Tetraparma gracilis TaxID=2962635 RepID=A0ABQ6MZ23_9STRA|nr:hypothetical protein TeGR_g14893 [Tetraparma gracilis]